MKGPDTSGLYKVTRKDIKRCAMSLASAFSEDEGMVGLTGGKNVEKRLYSLFRFIVTASLRHDCVYAVSPVMEGVVIWLPEGVTYLSTWDFFTRGGIGMIIRHGFEMPLKIQKYENFASCRHNEHISEPHWYLLALAVVKEHRKKGYSSKLMNPFLDYFDANGIPAYLETGRGNNEAMYRHYGFDLMEKIESEGSGSVFKAMLRRPSTGKKVRNA